MNIRKILADQPIRYKLFVSYFGGFMMAVLLGSYIIYSFMRSTIETNIENELKISTTTILNMVQTAATVSVKNYLRAVVEKNKEIVEYCYGQYKAGLISEEEAKRRAADLLLSQKIGRSGYIYCIDSQGVLRVHPKKELVGVNISEYPFAREQKSRKDGYIEYEWKNPGELEERSKALHMTYFEPWDWIISASSYRDEFSELVNVNDFRDSILSLRFGKMGYSYVINLKGELIIHPQLEGKNILDEAGVGSRKFIARMCEERNGKIIYPWQNPGDPSPREKLVIFNYIPELGWIVASSSYLQEFYQPLNTFRELMLFGVFMSLFIFLPITLRISTSITNPLKELKDKFGVGATGDFSVRMAWEAKDEIGSMAIYFNTFMEKLEAYSTDLQKEIQERKQVEEALRASEEMFSKAFRSSPNGIVIAALSDLRIINVNESLLAMTGYTSEELINRKLAEFKILPDGEEIRILQQDQEKIGMLHSMPIEFVTKSGMVRTGILSAEIIELWGEAYLLATIEDVTEAQRLEKEIMDISEKERLRIGEDLHDDLCPHLIGIEVLGQVLKRKLQEKKIDEVVLAEKIQGLISDAIQKTRSLARGLCPVNLATHGLKSSIEDLVDNVSDVFQVSCRFDCTCPVFFHDNAVATQLYYITHEAVHNAVKHGRVKNIVVRLSREDGKYLLTVTDDGSGINTSEKSTGMGLRIMGLRAKKIGAEFSIGRSAAGGTAIIVNFLKKDPFMEQVDA
ncbi:MAG: cache domain-containing protein [Desulfocapsaceae bacterium]|nr:cache domain-containing protein [Desulfocapsaceae bacterium]